MHRAYISSRSGQIHYREAGSPDGAPVAFIHQSPCSSVMYEQLMLCMPHTLRLVAPDTPGFGQSSDLIGDLSIEALAAELQDALSRLDPRPWHIFGHHTGSLVSMAIAHAGRLPLATLSLSGPPYLDAELRRLLTDLYQSPSDDIDAHVRESWERIRAAAADVPPELLLRDFAQGLLVKDLPGVYAAAIRFEPLAALSNVSVPTMVLAGGRDPIRTGFPHIQNALPDARYVAIDDGGIQMCETHAALIAGYLAEFVAAHPA